MNSSALRLDYKFDIFIRTVFFVVVDYPSCKICQILNTKLTQAINFCPKFGIKKSVDIVNKIRFLTCHLILVKCALMCVVFVFAY